MNSKETQINIILSRDREPRDAGIVDIRFIHDGGRSCLPLQRPLGGFNGKSRAKVKYKYIVSGMQ